MRWCANLAGPIGLVFCPALQMAPWMWRRPTSKAEKLSSTRLRSSASVGSKLFSSLWYTNWKTARSGVYLKCCLTRNIRSGTYKLGCDTKPFACASVLPLPRLGKVARQA